MLSTRANPAPLGRSYVCIARYCIVRFSAVAAGAVTASAATAALPEFVGTLPQTFTSTLKPSTLEVVAGGIKVSCTGDSNAGEVTGPKSLTIKIKLVGCTLNAVPCRSGVTAGEIETSTLTGTLGYIDVAKKQVGLDLSQPAGALFMTFACGEDLTVDVKGSVIGTIKPVDKVHAPPKHFSVKFAQEGHPETDETRRCSGGHSRNVGPGRALPADRARDDGRDPVCGAAAGRRVEDACGERDAARCRRAS